MKDFHSFGGKLNTVYNTAKGMKSDDIFCFDTETTSAFLTESGEIYSDRDDREDEWFNKQTPLSLCYEWTFLHNGDTYYGREIHDFLYVMDKLRDTGVKVVVWVHNLGFDFVFLLNCLRVAQVFARQTRHPMKVVFEGYENIEFRCTYILTRLSLESWGQSLGVNKKVGDLDYNVIRTPKTYLTEKELNYCKYDVLVMYEGIKKELKEYKHIHDIPLTQTGKVRRVVKKRLTKEKGYLKFIAKLTPRSAEEYRRLTSAYAGGYTHANMIYVDRLLHNVYSYDFASSYPYIMVSSKFPMTPFYKGDLKNDFENYAYLLKITLTNVKPLLYNHYISKHKCLQAQGYTLDNGRIISADKLTLWVTEQDYDIIRQAYSFDFELLECWKARKGYLPKAFVEYVLELYGNKTTLKNVVGAEELYMKSKEFVNAMYGMMCTALLQDEISFDGYEWTKTPKTEREVDEYLQMLIEEPKRKNFLSFAWGVWVCAYGRHNIWENIIPNDEYVAYVDTDSIKATKKLDIDNYNKKVVDNLKKSSRFLKIPLEKYMPKDTDGVTRIIGKFEFEGVYKEFITQGAKRYAYRNEKGLNITVSGVPKSASIALEDNILNFRDGFRFPRNLKREDGKRAASSQITYITDCNENCVTWNKGKYDEYISCETYGVNIRRKAYTMGITEEFSMLLASIASKKGLEVIES